MSQIHPQARTTPRVRAEIQASEASPAELARRYNISEPTAAKWYVFTPPSLTRPPSPSTR